MRFDSKLPINLNSYICGLHKDRGMGKQVCIWVLALIMLAGCETDIDLNAPYQQIPVIYGILDVAKPVQYIRIQRSFLGEGDARDAALIADSSYYSDIQPALVRLNADGAGDTLFLRDTILDPRKPGDFFQEPNRLYYFQNDQGFLQAEEDYRLVFEADDRLVQAQTKVMKPVVIDRPFGPNVGSVPLFNNDYRNNQTGNFRSFRIEYDSERGFKRFEHEVLFKFREVLSNGEENIKEVVVKLQDSRLSTDNSLIEIEVITDGEFLFRSIAEKLDENPDVVRREILNGKVKVYGAAEDLDTYLQSSEPITSIVTQRPTFTNVEYGDELGVGIFSSSYSAEQAVKWDVNTHIAMALHPILKDFKFCSNEGSVSNDPSVACPD